MKKNANAGINPDGTPKPRKFTKKELKEIFEELSKDNPGTHNIGYLVNDDIGESIRATNKRHDN